MHEKRTSTSDTVLGIKKRKDYDYYMSLCL